MGLDPILSLIYNTEVEFKTMSVRKSSLTIRFKSDLTKLTAAVSGEVTLDEEYPRLYQKLIRYYEERGVQLYDDPEDDYNVILDSVEAALIESGVF